MIMATDYSAGNDVIIAKNGINSIQDLRGKTVATEKGLVDHLLLSTALEDAKIGMNEVKLVNTMTNELPQVLPLPILMRLRYGSQWRIRLNLQWPVQKSFSPLKTSRD